MRIGIDSRELLHQPAGKGQYLLRILEQWLAEPPAAGITLVLYVQPGEKKGSLLENLAKKASDRIHLEVITERGRAIFWHQRIARRLKADRINVFFAPLSYQSAMWNKVPTVTTVHDLAVFLVAGIAHNKRSQFIEKRFLKRCVKKSAALITVSESTAHDLVKITAMPRTRIAVTLLAPLLQAPSPIAYEKREPYLLFVGTLEPRKNVSGLLQAYALLPAELRQAYSLILAGKKGWGGEDYVKQAEDLGIVSEVVFKGYVASEELPGLYGKAMAMVYPSLYEGFGLPVAEAMAFATPVITSTTSSLPEVVGNGGILCEPTDYSSIAQAMETLLTNPRVWHEKSQAALHRAQNFSWQKTAEQTFALLAAAAH